MLLSHVRQESPFVLFLWWHQSMSQGHEGEHLSIPRVSPYQHKFISCWDSAGSYPCPKILKPCSLLLGSPYFSLLFRVHCKWVFCPLSKWRITCGIIMSMHFFEPAWLLIFFYMVPRGKQYMALCYEVAVHRLGHSKKEISNILRPRASASKICDVQILSHYFVNPWAHFIDSNSIVTVEVVCAKSFTRFGNLI